jgi:hypothetical protein
MLGRMMNFPSYCGQGVGNPPLRKNPKSKIQNLKSKIYCPFPPDHTRRANLPWAAWAVTARQAMAISLVLG